MLSNRDAPTPEDLRRSLVVSIADALTRIALLVDTSLEELASEPLTPRAREIAAGLGPVGQILSDLQPGLGQLAR